MKFETNQPAASTFVTLTKAECLLVLLHSSKDASRFNLCTVLLDLKNNRIVTTNGASLHVLRSGALDLHKKHPDLPDTVLLNREPLEKAVKKLKAKDNVQILLTVTPEGPKAVARTAEDTTDLDIEFAAFPHYEQVIPKARGIAGFQAQTKNHGLQDAIAFNGKVLGDHLLALNRIQKEPMIRLATLIDSLSPMVFEARSPDADVHSTLVLMPMRL